ncbi:hypothetical protein [Tuwongella immobilis]|uniref:Uncharacterized protein n=1 Tax=Tuwongella immobilis TaxID=692036 RepID=A0A6C2YWI5_9BACT|nr:hypothetical protein [Tuwongella immobilis]VIP05205.1 unnamed protein product [Tuwongella immobilis]VTS07766.1 unnamed protein product [Tuwongella immobilis]
MIDTENSDKQDYSADSFIIRLRHTYSIIDKLANEMVRNKGKIYNYGLMHALCRQLTQYDEPHRIYIIEYLDSHIDLFGDDQITNMICVGFVESIQDDQQLEKLIHGTSVQKNRKIVCQFFITHYIPTSYDIPMELLRLYTGKQTMPGMPN